MMYYEHFSLERLHFNPFLSIPSSGRWYWQQLWGLMGEVLSPPNSRVADLLSSVGALSPSNTRVPGLRLLWPDIHLSG